MTAWMGIRYRADTGWEYRCEQCALSKIQCYWPLTLEFWNPDKGMTRCRACWNQYTRTRRMKRRPQGELVAETNRRRAYARDWAATRRRLRREAEGREKYGRRAA